MSNTAKVCWCLSCMDENQLVADVVFPLVEAGFSSYCGVDAFQELFANSPDLAFGKLDP